MLANLYLIVCYLLFSDCYLLTFCPQKSKNLFWSMQVRVLAELKLYENPTDMMHWIISIIFIHRTVRTDEVQLRFSLSFLASKWKHIWFDLLLGTTHNHMSCSQWTVDMTWSCVDSHGRTVSQCVSFMFQTSITWKPITWKKSLGTFPPMNKNWSCSFPICCKHHFKGSHAKAVMGITVM